MNHDQIVSWIRQQQEIDARRERAENKTLAGILAALAIAFFLGVMFADKPRDLAQCTTDAECAELCDPKDGKCDGGPQ